jgi:hypothetical protein
MSHKDIADLDDAADFWFNVHQDIMNDKCKPIHARLHRYLSIKDIQQLKPGFLFRLY